MMELLVYRAKIRVPHTVQLLSRQAKRPSFRSRWEPSPAGIGGQWRDLCRPCQAVNRLATFWGFRSTW